MQTLHIYVDSGYKACGEFYSCTYFASLQKFALKKPPASLSFIIHMYNVDICVELYVS